MVSKESWSSNTYTGQNRLENEDCNKIQKRALYNGKGDNLTTKYNSYKYAPNMRAPISIKHLITNIKKLIPSNTIGVEDFKTPLTSMDRSSEQEINKLGLLGGSGSEVSDS